MNNFITKREANCDSHGSYTSQRRAHRPGIWSSCPTCIRLEIEQDKRDDRVSLTSIRREARINSIGIPPRYMTASLDESPYADQVRKWLADGVGSLFLVGPVGNGKTTLACAICIFAAWNGKIARYMSVSSFMQKIRDVWKNNSGTEAEIIAPLVKCDLLVIDDVGATRGLDSETFRLHELIVDRYDRGLPTIVVSNLSTDELRQALGDRAYDRLRENAMKIAITIPSRRKPN